MSETRYLCTNCPHSCNLAANGSGICKARTLNDRKEIISANYGQITSLALDPIEKKPLKMFFPGSYILSAGSWGCNMKCPWCQNESISRGPAGYIEMTPDKLALLAMELCGHTDFVPAAYAQADLIPAMHTVLDTLPGKLRRYIDCSPGKNRNIGIAYTYNEPLISPEFVLETASAVRSQGLKNVLVTNGMVKSEVLAKLLPYTDALNIDLKTINARKYSSIGGDLETVLGTIKAAGERAHVEVTTLIVPGFNDDEAEMKKLAETLCGINRSIPLHVTRFFPAAKMRNTHPTPVKTVLKMAEIAGKHLENVFTGNI